MSSLLEVACWQPSTLLRPARSATSTTRSPIGTKIRGGREGEGGEVYNVSFDMRAYDVLVMASCPSIPSFHWFSDSSWSP